jgi:iron complex transport system substrate-binding protein
MLVAAVAALFFTAVAPAAEPPRRIIALSPSVVEIAYEIGAQGAVVGISSYADYPPRAKTEKPVVGGVVDVDVEKVIALDPDVIISNPSVMARERLEPLGFELVFLPDQTLEEIAASFISVGVYAGKPDSGRALATRFTESVSAAKRRSSGRASLKAVAVIGYEPLWVAGGEGFLNELLEAAGFTNAAGAVKKDFYAADFERILAAAPDVIIDLTLEGPGDEAARGNVKAFWNRFQSIPAVKSGRIEFIDSDLLTIPGPRLVKGLAALESIARAAGGEPSQPAAPEEGGR